MDLNSILIGVVVGFAVGAILFTPSGREITRATGHRTARAIYRD